MKALRTSAYRNSPFFSLAQLFLLIIFLLLFSSGNQAGQTETKAYRAEIAPLNESVTGKMPAGFATLEIEGDSLTIRVSLSNLPPGMMHLQHYHGFIDGGDATCAGMAQDANNDGIVDLIETEAVSGVTLVPFHDDPASLEIKTHSYPVADELGNVSYTKTLSLAKLKQGLRKAHNIEEPLFGKRVVYIHGIDPSDSLPASVQSLPDVPAHVTLPIACGELQQLR